MDCTEEECSVFLCVRVCAFICVCVIKITEELATRIANRIQSSPDICENKTEGQVRARIHQTRRTRVAEGNNSINQFREMAAHLA